MGDSERKRVSLMMRKRKKCLYQDNLTGENKGALCMYVCMYDVVGGQ
jgi:hypothetical protein